MSIFVTEIVDEEWGNYFKLTGAGYGVLIAVMIVMLLFACLIGNAGERKKFSTKALVFSAMAMALGMVTSMVKLFDLPMGGSVTLCSMCLSVWWAICSGLRQGFLQRWLMVFCSW